MNEMFVLCAGCGNENGILLVCSIIKVIEKLKKENKENAELKRRNHVKTKNE